MVHVGLSLMQQNLTTSFMWVYYNQSVYYNKDISELLLTFGIVQRTGSGATQL